MVRLVLYIFTLLFALSCSNSEEQLKPFKGSVDGGPELSKDVEIIYSDSAIVKAKVNAETVKRFKGENAYTEMPDGIIALFYDPTGTTNAKLSANYAIRKEKEKEMEAIGKVVVVNEEGDTLTTERLVWDEMGKRIFTDKFVTIKTKTETIYGEGLESNQDFSKYRILKPTGELKLTDPINE